MHFRCAIRRRQSHRDDQRSVSSYSSLQNRFTADLRIAICYCCKMHHLTAIHVMQDGECLLDEKNGVLRIENMDRQWAHLKTSFLKLSILRFTLEYVSLPKRFYLQRNFAFCNSFSDFQAYERSDQDRLQVHSRAAQIAPLLWVWVGLDCIWWETTSYREVFQKKMFA